MGSAWAGWVAAKLAYPPPRMVMDIANTVALIARTVRIKTLRKACERLWHSA
ncbi:hypothetical protein KIM372_14240 [Bombiscardovia nodaiensis]|uniref:Uncharacterized protein n=1 Tax=Bombiscardovia nodaiensis TaxID=2932181 RepID=A0ABM8B9G5_9BIFI|nr:hypothetical protein KIM372_14240 [Bombiscardovia nodaiensis]